MENPEAVLRLLNVSGKKMTEEFAFSRQFGIIGQLISNIKVKLMVDEKSLAMSSFKAVVPIAGKGARLEPMTKVVPKALFPMVDRSKKVRTVLQVLLEDIAQVGIEDVAVITSPDQKNIVKAYLDVIHEINDGTLPSHICFQTTPQG